MFNHIENTLLDLGLNADKRVLHIQFSNRILNKQLYLQRVEGEHRLNQGINAELLCLSTNTNIALKQFIGCQVAVDSLTDHGRYFRMSGIISTVERGQSDGALTIYKLQLSDPTVLWRYRRNSRVFMAKSVIEIVEIIFKEWQQKSPIFAASLTLDLSDLSREYDVRPFVMQYNETDAQFLKRLLRQEGINYLVDEAQLLVTHPSTQIAAQKIRLIDDNNRFKRLERTYIRYHRNNATDQQDHIYTWIAQRSMQSTAVYVQRWQAAALVQETGTGSVLSRHQPGQMQDNSCMSLEQAWHLSPAWVQDLNGEDHATASSNTQIKRINENFLNYHTLAAKQFRAESTVRDAQVGYWFRLSGHPEIDSKDDMYKEFIIIEKWFYQQNNFPKDLFDQIERLAEKNNWQSDIQTIQQRQANRLVLQRREIPIVPDYHPSKHRPNVHPMRAKVVGPSHEEIYVDQWGRIKVRFLFTRDEDHLHAGGAGANDNDRDSAWLDVLTPWAGEAYGTSFLPRIGEIVVVDFFDGDIDRPFVLGRIHEGSRIPTQFDMQGQLPDTKQLSGIRSKEVAGVGFGQLRFDDTTGQISSQLQSSHGLSQLNLGRLSYPKETEKSDDRGEGFELRTDQSGALRAGDGLLISTHKQEGAKGQHLNAEAAKQQLDLCQSRLQSLNHIAQHQQTHELESIQHIQTVLTQIETDFAKFNQALLLLSAPESVVVSTNDSIHLSADQQINQSAGDSINLSTQNNLIVQASNHLGLFAAHEGMKLVAAQGAVELVAQSDALSLLAKTELNIISTQEQIEIESPKEIVLRAGGVELNFG